MPWDLPCSARKARWTGDVITSVLGRFSSAPDEGWAYTCLRGAKQRHSRCWAPAGWSSLQELDLDDRARREPGIKVVFSSDAGEQVAQHAPALGWIGHEDSAGREVDAGGFLEMKHELWICHEICVPVAAPWEAADVDSSTQVVKPDLDPARQSGSPARCSDIDGAIASSARRTRSSTAVGFPGTSDKGVDRLAVVVDKIEGVAVSEARAAEVPGEAKRHVTGLVKLLQLSWSEFYLERA